MRNVKNSKNSKKTMKTITIAAAAAIFGIGAAFAVHSAGSAESKDVQIVKTQAAAGRSEDTATKKNAMPVQTPIEKVTEKATVQVETEPVTELSTEVPTEAPTEESGTIQTPAPASQTEAVQTPAQSEAPKVEPKQEVLTELSEDDINHEQAKVNSVAYAAYINEIYNLINQKRTEAGVAAVSYDSTLTVMSCHRAYENAKNDCFVVDGGHHKRPNGEKASTICLYYGQYGSFGEIMGRYQPSPVEIVDGWCSSGTHYACMTNAKYTRVGVGVAQDSKGGYYWTAIFMN